MCFNKTAALQANKVSLWLQPDEQTSRLLARIQLELGTASLPASCLTLSRSHTYAHSHSHKISERSRQADSLCVYDSLSLLHPSFIRHFPFSASREGGLLPKSRAVQNICAWLAHNTCTYTLIHTHTRSKI